jgi:hypothetical protein
MAGAAMQYESALCGSPSCRDATVPSVRIPSWGVEGATMVPPRVQLHDARVTSRALDHVPYRGSGYGGTWYSASCTVRSTIAETSKGGEGWMRRDGGKYRGWFDGVT